MTNHQLSSKGFLVWGICAAFFLYEFFLRTVIGTFQTPIMQDLGLTSLQFSLLSSTIFMIVYGLMQIPVGFIVDSIGLKRSVGIGALCCTISSFGFAYSQNYWLSMINRAAMGFGASFGFICLLVSVNDWMPNKYRALFIGLSLFIGTLGPMLAAGPLDSLSESGAVSWRIIFSFLGALGIVLMVLVFFFVENNQEKAGQYIILNRPEKLSSSFKKLFSRLQPWYIAIVSAGLYFTIEYLSENEGRAFLALKGISFTTASYMISIAWIGFAIGCPLVGYISDIIRRRKIIMSTAAAIGLTAIIMIVHAQAKPVLQLAFFLLGLSASGQTIGFATLAEQFKKQLVALGFALNNAMITTLAAINAPLIGFLLDLNKEADIITLQGYVLVFNILIAMAVITLFVAVFCIQETYGKSKVDFVILKPTSGKKNPVPQNPQT